jgi:hypothetical protein
MLSGNIRRGTNSGMVRALLKTELKVGHIVPLTRPLVRDSTA